MTNELAIKVLKELRGYGDKFANIGYDRKEALDLAIKALEQTELNPSYNSVKPELDCISREAVEKITWEEPSYTDALNVLTEVREKVRALPSVTPKAEWIPCSEKMPDINIHVLAQFVMGGMAECYYAHNWWHIVGGFRISGDEVIAWMPLPEPYAESEKRNDE